MKNFVLPIALSALALGVMVAAHADQQVPAPWSVQVGASWPGSSDAKQVQGTTVLNAGVDYAFSQTKGKTPLAESVYVDYDGGSKSGVLFKPYNNKSYDGQLYAYGIGVAARQSLAASGGLTPYYGAGIGVYETASDYKVPGTSFTDKTATGVGGKIFAGLNFTGNYFVQVAYNWLPTDDLKVNSGGGSATDKLNPSNFALDIGYRF
jgi:opacity protein-like surface antigen